MSGRLILLVQLGCTLAILAFVPTNLGKAVALLALWIITLRRLTPAETVLFVAGCAVFTTMDFFAVGRGVFHFTSPDVLRQPVWELVMWGFYLVHTRRLVGGPVPPRRWRITATLAILFAAAFALLPDQRTLLAGSTLLLVVMLIIFHDGMDVAYVVYMVALGAAVEFTGVLSGQWGYPGEPALGVPLWFISMWGGVGWLLRRLVLPALELLPEQARSAPADGVEA